VIGLGAVAGLLVGALAFVVDGDRDQPSEIAQSIDAGGEVVTDLGAALNSTTTAVRETEATLASTASTVLPAVAGSSPVLQTTTTTPLPSEPIPYLAVGDSIMLGAAPALTDRGMVVDAVQNRQMIDVIPVFEQLRDRHLFGSAVVVHLGNNGSFSQATLDAFLATMDEVPNVILMTVRADRPWTADNNALLRAADLEGDNKILIDWEVLAAECPGECFYGDGMHLRPDGQEYYANLITDIVGI
jgi:hypothetical protein